MFRRMQTVSNTRCSSTPTYPQEKIPRTSSWTAVCLTLDTIVAPPDNDLCANAAILLTDTPKTGTNIGAEGDLISSCSYSDTKDVWYQWTPDQSGTAVISLCDSSDFDTTLSVYDGCGGTELVCNDDYCELVSALTLEATAGPPIL